MTKFKKKRTNLHNNATPATSKMMLGYINTSVMPTDDSVLSVNGHSIIIKLDQNLYGLSGLIDFWNYISLYMFNIFHSFVYFVWINIVTVNVNYNSNTFIPQQILYWYHLYLYPHINKKNEKRIILQYHFHIEYYNFLDIWTY